MTVELDPRLEARRKLVREQGARTRTRRLLWILIGFSVVGATLWVSQSPWLSLDQVVVHGVRASNATAVLQAQEVVVGRPLVGIRPGHIEEVLLEDPWVSEARVDVILPDTVEIHIVERQPVAWLGDRGSWMLLARDGVVLAAGVPAESDYLIELPSEQAVLGEQYPDLRVTGAVEFLSHLAAGPPVVITEADGELWADVSDVSVRLGRPLGMAAKAASLDALLETGVEAGSTIVLVAPTRPAVIQASRGPGLQPQQEP